MKLLRAIKIVLHIVTLGFWPDPLCSKEAQESIRGISDERLKFVPTQNLVLIAIARLMEAEGVNDEVLIEELYLRGRANMPKPESKK